MAAVPPSLFPQQNLCILCHNCQKCSFKRILFSNCFIDKIDVQAMDRKLIDTTGKWFAVYNGTNRWGSNGERQVVQLQYLPFTNAILGVTSERGLMLFDASSGECLQDFKIGCGVGRDLLLCYHNCTGSIVMSDGYSLGYRGQTNGSFYLKTTLQTPVFSDNEIVAVELSLSEAELLMDLMQAEALLSAVGANSSQSVHDMLELLMKEVNSHHSESTGSHLCKLTSKPSTRYATVHFCMQQSILRSTCETLLKCCDSKSSEDGLPVLDESCGRNHRPILRGMAVVSSILHQLMLLYNEEKTDVTESSTLPGSCGGVMCSELNRRSSFANWPHSKYRHAQPSTMAEAGFFHQPAATGDDRAICFACEVCLVCWEPTDEPWSEHERHSPSCPFVRCESTLNVPIAMSYAHQPASSIPLPQRSDTHDIHSGAEIEFLAVGENCDLVVAASRGGDFIYWDTSSRMPVLRNVSTINKSDVESELFGEIATNSVGDSTNFPSAADLHIVDYSVSSLCIIDCLESIPNFTAKHSQTQSHRESQQGDDHINSMTELSLQMKQPVLAFGTVVKLTSTLQEPSVEEINTTLYYSLLIFASCEHSASRNSEETFFTTRMESSEAVGEQYDKAVDENIDACDDCLVQQNASLPDLAELDIPDLSDSTQSFLTKYCKVLEDPSLYEEESQTNSKFLAASQSGRAVRMKILQVVIIDHKEEHIKDKDQRLQVVKNIAVSKVSNKLIATSLQETISCTEESHNLDSTDFLTDTEIDHMVRAGKDSTVPASFQSAEKLGRVMVFDLMHSTSLHCVMPIFFGYPDKDKTWITAPAVLQMIELPNSVASGVCGDEADGDSCNTECFEGDVKSYFEPDLDNFLHIEHALMLLLGSDGILRLFDINQIKIVYEVAPALSDDATNERFTAVTYCSNIDQICAVTSSGKISFIKIGKLLHTERCFHGLAIEDATVSSDSNKRFNHIKPRLKNDELLVNHPLTESGLQTLLQLTKFEKLEPKFHAKAPPHWIEIQIKGLASDFNCPFAFEDVFQTIPRKARLGQSDVPVQVKQQRRHLHHPNEHYASDAHLHTHAWRLPHDSAKQEVVELLFRHVTNISHIDLHFVLSRKLKPGTDIQFTLLKLSNSSKRRASDVKSSNSKTANFTNNETQPADNVDKLYQRYKHLLTASFVEQTMEKDVKNPMLLVIAANLLKENISEFILMDCSKKTIVAICKHAPSDICCGSLLKLTEYTSVQLGTDKRQLVLESLEIYTEANSQAEINISDNIEKTDDPSVSQEDLDPEKTYNKEPKHPAFDSSGRQHLNYESSDVLFGPVLLSNYVDVTNLGGVITMASRRLVKNPMHSSLLLLVENVPDVKLLSDNENNESNGEFRFSACLQELSITVFKSKRVDKVHDRSQRFGLLSTRTLHAELLSSLCDDSACTGLFVSSSLSRKVVVLDILNWVAALETADPNEMTSANGFLNNDGATDAATRSFTEYQTLAHLLCFFKSKETAPSKFTEKNRNVKTESFDKLSEMQFTLGNFLINCFLESGRDIGIRALRLIIHTVLSADVQGQGQYENTSGAEVFYGAIIQCLKYATKTAIKSTYGLYCLYRILYMLMAKSDQSGNILQLRNPVDKLTECVKLLVDLSSMIDSHIHPLNVILRSRYGLYASPFEFTVMASDLDNQKNRSRQSPKPTDNRDIPTHSWEKFFSEEEVDMCAFITPQKIDLRKVIDACGISDGYYNSQLACIECQPLHFNCIQASEACSVSFEADSMADCSFQNSLDAGLPGSRQNKDDHIDTLEHVEGSMLKNWGVITNVLECYTDMRNTFPTDISETNSKDCGKGVDQNNLDLEPERNRDVLETSSEMNDSKVLGDPDTQSKIDVNYDIPNLSFIPPRSTQLTISRMYSGDRRKAVLDFCHIIELSDIHIPACKSLSCFIVEAWPANIKSQPSLDATEFIKIAISLDICDHDFNISPISPTILTRFLRVTVIGRYGSSNAETVVSLGSFHGHPACICTKRMDQNKNSAAISPETLGESLSNSSTENQSNIEVTAFRITDATVATNGNHAIERYLISLQNYSECLNCRYQLACSELKSLIPISASNLGSFISRVGNTHSTLVQSVRKAYKTCIMIQLQRSRLQHAIAHIQSVSKSSKASTKSYMKENQSITLPQIEIHCELMLNLLLSVCQDVLRANQHMVCDTIFASSHADTIFKNLVGLPNPRIRVQATGVLLSYYAPFQKWGSFLVSCLTHHFTMDYSRKQWPSHNHIFCNILLLGQRSLAIPGKGEEIFESVMNLISNTLPEAGEQIKDDTNFKLLSYALLLLSHLTETIIIMNESFASKENPQILSWLSSDVDCHESLSDSASHMNAMSPCSEEVTGSEPAPPKAKKIAKAYLWHPNTSNHAPDPAADKSSMSEVPRPSIPARHPRSISWDFMSLSGMQNKGVNGSALSHLAKVLKWLQSVKSKLVAERKASLLLHLEERSLQRKIEALEKDGDDNGLNDLKAKLSVIRAKIKERMKVLVGYRKILDKKAVKSMIQPKAFSKTWKDSANLPQSSSFIKVPMELCMRVTKQILSMLLHHTVVVPADLIVLSCKVCSQLFHWASFQCVHENMQNDQKDRKIFFSPLSLTSLLNSDDLTKLLLLSSGTGTRLFGSQYYSAPAPMTGHNIPWICHAFRNLLCDLMKYENAGCFSSSETDSTFNDDKDFITSDSDTLSSQNESSDCVHSDINSPTKADDSNGSRWKIVDNFIQLSELYIADVKNVIKSHETPLDSGGGYYGIHEHLKYMDAKSKQFGISKNHDKEFLKDTGEFFQKMGKLYLNNEVSNNTWSAKCPESDGIWSHVFDQRGVHGVGRKVLLTSKLSSIYQIESVAESLGIPPSTSLAHTNDHRYFFEGCSSTHDCCKSTTALQISINQILDRFITNAADFSAVCDVILAIQHSYSGFVSKFGPSLLTRPNVIGLSGLKKLMKVAISDSITFRTDNVRLWNLMLNLLKTFTDKKQNLIDQTEVQKLLEPDFGMSSLLTRIVSAKLSASCSGHAHVHTSLLGPSVCNNLEKCLDNLHALAIDGVLPDYIEPSQTKSHVSGTLKLFYIHILSSLVENSAFDCTSSAPVDGQITFVKAMTKIYNDTSNKSTFTGDAICLTKIIDGISYAALHYLSWSKSNFNRNPTGNIVPSIISLDTPQSEQGKWLRKSPRDELMLTLLKLASLLCQDCIVIDEEFSTEQSVSDMLFKEENTIHMLLSALSISKGSAAIHDSVNSFLLDTQITATTTCDGVMLLLLSLFNSNTAASAKVHCLINYLRGNVQSGNRVQELVGITNCISYPLLMFITQIFCSFGALIDAFIADGGLTLIVNYLVLSTNQDFDSRNNLVSQTMQYLTAASDRSQALSPRQPVQMPAEPNCPLMKGFNPHPKIPLKDKYYHFAKGQSEAVMFTSAPTSKISTGNWKTEEFFEYSTIATIECSDSAAIPADSLLKPKAAHRRTRTAVWSYHFPGHENWVSLTLHFPVAFVLTNVQVFPVILSLSNSPSAVILEVNQSGISDDSYYQPVSTPLVTSGMGEIVLVPPTKEVVYSIRIHLKRPIQSASIGLTRISVTGTSFISNEHPTINSTSFMKINSTMFPTSHDSSSNTSIWIMLLYHITQLRDANVLREIQNTALTISQMVPTLCTLLEFSSLPAISHAIETILMKAAVVAKPLELIDCIFKSQGQTRYFHRRDETYHDPTDHFVHIIYKMCMLEDDELQLRLGRCLYWIKETCRLATSIDNLSAVNPNYIHAISCGIWECADTKSAKAVLSDSLLKSIYDSVEFISHDQPVEFSSSKYSLPLKESLDWVLCSLCQIDVNCYLSVLNWMGFDLTNPKVTSLTNSQIETLASITQTEHTADIFLSRGIITLFANGLQRFCQTLIETEVDDKSSDTLDGMVDVNSSNVVVVVNFFSHLCNILPIQCWFGTEQGTRCWHALLLALDQPMRTINQGLIAAYPQCTFPISSVIDLQESTVNLVKQITRCNEKNCKVVSSAICNMISSHTGRPAQRMAFSGFLRSLLLQVILEDEIVTVHVKSQSVEQLRWNNASNGMSRMLRHPIFGTGYFNHVVDVRLKSAIKDISSIITGICVSSSKRQGIKKSKEATMKLENHSQKPPTFSSVSKPTIPIPAFSMSPGEISHIQLSGKNAQDKRKSQVGNVDSLLADDKQDFLLPSIFFSCDEAKIGCLRGDDTLMQVLERYKAQQTYMFFKRIQLEVYCTMDTSAQRKKSDSHVAISNPKSSNKTSKERQNETSNVNDTQTKAKSMFQVFAESGGLCLIASHLPSLTLNAGPVSVNEVAKAILTEDRRRFHGDSVSYMDNVSDWIAFDDDEDMDTTFDEASILHPGVEFSMSDSHTKHHMPISQAISTSENSLLPMKCCVPAFTFTALRSFLQVPLFAEELLKDYSTAKCLMRLTLGVMDDGKGQYIPDLALAPALSLLPFHALSQLLSEYDCSMPSGLQIREAMTFQTMSLHIVFGGISRYSHNQPTMDSNAGKLLKSVLSQGLSAHSIPKKSTIAIEKNYWADGTGFGTGSTSSDWNPEEVMKKQKNDEKYLTIFIQILGNFVCPAPVSSDFDSESVVKKCVASNGNLVETFTDLVTASGLTSAVASYLRNDSVLDMSSHVQLYHALLSMIRSFSLCPTLRRLLTTKVASMEHPGAKAENVGHDSIINLLTKMKKCIDTYSNRLEALNTSLDSHGDEGFSIFVSNVQETEHMLRTIIQDSDNNLHPQEGKLDISSKPAASMKSLEEVYINKMKKLQFDTALLVRENEKGNYVFPSGHHYKSQIKESANVADSSRARRLAQEAVTLSNSLPLSLGSTVFVRCDEERLDVMKVLITGPIDTPYANGCFEFDVFFPADYNKSPPLVNLRTTGNQSVRFNPNLYNDGKVCLSILNTWHGRPEERWNSQTSSFLQILVSIQSLILVKEPYFNEPGYERSRGTPSGKQCSMDYDANIQQATVKWAMLEQLKKPSECFRNVILNHFWMKKGEISEQCDKWLAQMKNYATQHKGRKGIAQNFSALQRYVEQLQTELHGLVCPPSPDDSEESDD